MKKGESAEDVDSGQARIENYRVGLLVEREPDPSMQISIIVPVYAEYENGNIFRMLESFNRQTVPPPEF